MPEQERQCEAFAAAQGRTIDFVWSDEGISGRDTSRLERLTDWCEKHRRPKTDRGLIVVLKRDRWARFTHDDNASGYYEYRLSQAGWDVDFVLEPKTKNKTADAVLATIHRRMASEESEERGRRASVGMVAQARRGHWQGRAPYGYDRLVTSGTGKTRRLGPGEHGAEGERSKLVPGPAAEVRTVRRIFQLAAEGVSFDDIAARLNAAKVPGPWVRYLNLPRKDGTPKRPRADGKRAPEGWTGFGQVARILKNVAYVGVVRWWPYGEDGETRDKEPIVVEDAHEALVDRALFDKVQLRFKTKRTRVSAPGRYLLPGILRCVCGAEFTGGGGQRRYVVARVGTHVQVGGLRSGEFRLAKAGERGTYVEVKDPERFQFYKCPRCREPRQVTVNKRWMEGRVIEIVSQHVNSVLKDGTFDEVLDRIMSEQSGQRRKGRKDIETERAELRQELDRLVQAVAAGSLRPEEVKPLADALRTSLEQLEHDRQRGKFEERGAMLSPKERLRLKAMARDFPARIKGADIVTARELLSAWVSEIVVDGKNPRKRTGRLVLRAVPIGFSDSHPVRPGRGKRCSQDVSPAFFPS
ncbi:MAG: recombinase family protein [Gemmatimonadota bacterium]|nr:recombinase family protein [Gemmatimonadota bacterium]